VANGEDGAALAFGEPRQGSEDGAHLVGPVDVGLSAEVGDDGVKDDEARAVGGDGRIRTAE
jgi:hypothetical protein